MSRAQVKTSVAVVTILVFWAAGILIAGDNTTVRSVSATSVTSRPIRLDVPLVLVYVSAIGADGHSVPGLHKDEFALFEDGRPLSVSNFSTEDAPISIGLIFDMSGSMVGKIDTARAAVAEFLKMANPADEFCLITFNDRPVKVSEFTQDTVSLMRTISPLQPHGRTSMLDAVYIGINEMRHARYGRKALLIFSDGGDNHSRYSDKDVKRAVEESDVEIYAVDTQRPIQRNVARPMPLSREERLGPELFEEITKMNGGRHFLVEDANELPEIAVEIGREMRSVYTLGYTPGNEARDGRWHKIQVKLAPSRQRAIRLYSKSGYYALQP